MKKQQLAIMPAVACVVMQYISSPESYRKYTYTVATVKVSFMRLPYLSEGRCVIVVTHDPEVADTADLVLRMKDGFLTAA